MIINLKIKIFKHKKKISYFTQINSILQRKIIDVLFSKMKDEFQEKLDTDAKFISQAVKLQMPIVITSYTLPRNMELYIRTVTHQFLKECRQEHLFEYLNFCLTELLTNAKKANTKRVYFSEKKLDLNNTEDYKKGMEDFKEETLTNIDYYLELQKKAGLYIKLQLQLKADKIHIEIRNNSILTKAEEEKIQEKLNSVQKYTSLEEAFANALDQSEGAGLGIIIIVLMLQKVGLTEDNYQVFVKDNETITKLVLPCNEKIFGGTDMLSYQFVRLQETIPCSKEKIDEIQNYFSTNDFENPDLNINNRRNLLNIIAGDSTLSMLLFKNAIKKKISELNLIKVFNFFTNDELKKIYSPQNSEIHIIESNSEIKEYLEHSKKVAFFAYNLAENFKENLKISPEELYSLGLLNSFGMIILKSASEEQKQYVEDLLNNYDVADKIRDLFYSGTESSFLGMIYSKKIGLPEVVTHTLGYWNNFEEADKKYLPIIKFVYLAEILQYYNEKKLFYFQIDKDILKEFKISSEKHLKYILEQFNEEPTPPPNLLS